MCVSIIILVGCGETTEEVNNTVTEEPVAEIRLNNYISMVGNYSIKLLNKTTNDTIEGAIKDRNIVMKLPDTNGYTIKKGYIMYELDDRVKVYEKNPISDEIEAQLEFYDILNNMEDLTGKLVNSGSEEIDGNSYYFEEYNSDENRKVRFYFEGTNLKYVRIIQDDLDEMFEVLEILPNPSDTIFEVPTDYAEASE